MQLQFTYEIWYFHNKIDIHFSFGWNTIFIKERYASMERLRSFFSWNNFQYAYYYSTHRWHSLHSTQYTQSTNHDDTQLHLRRNKEYEIIKTDKIDQMYVCYTGCMCECVNAWMHAGSYLCICSVAGRSPREWMRGKDREHTSSTSVCVCCRDSHLNSGIHFCSDSGRENISSVCIRA